MNFKKLVSDAGTTLNRVVQMTEEKLTTVEITEIEPAVVNLMNKSELIERSCNELITNMTCLLVPNPALRAENLVMDILQQKSERSNNLDCLGQTMLNVGNSFSTNGKLGTSLCETGNIQVSIGKAEHDFTKSVNERFLTPMRTFVDQDCKGAAKERKDLENARIDLDAAKRHLKNARNEASKRAVKADPTFPASDTLVTQAEEEVSRTQTIFDRQVEQTKQVLKKLDEDFTAKSSVIKEFVRLQRQFYESSTLVLEDLEKKLETL